MAEWFYVQDGQQAGPVDAGQLVQWLGTGQLKRDDLVWRDGMANWVAAQSVPELHPAPQPAPAPMPMPMPMQPIPTAPLPYPNQTLQQPYAGYAPPAGAYSQYGFAPLPHSGVGIASLIIGIVAVLLMVLSFGYAIVFAAQQGPGRKPPQGTLMLIGFGIMLGLGLCVIGAILGIVALSPRRKRTLGIIGLIINGGILVIGGGFLLLGLLMK